MYCCLSKYPMFMALKKCFFVLWFCGLTGFSWVALSWGFPLSCNKMWAGAALSESIPEMGTYEGPLSCLGFDSGYSQLAKWIPRGNGTERSILRDPAKSFRILWPTFGSSKISLCHILLERQVTKAGPGSRVRELDSNSWLRNRKVALLKSMLDALWKIYCATVPLALRHVWIFILKVTC